MWSATGLKWPEYRYNFDNRTRWWNDLFENDFHEKEFPQTHRLVDKNRAICLLLLCFRFECGFIKFKSVQIETKREMPRFTIDIPFSWICVLYLFWPVCRTAHSTHIVSQSKNVWYHTNLHQQQQQQTVRGRIYSAWLGQNYLLLLLFVDVSWHLKLRQNEIKFSSVW